MLPSLASESLFTWLHLSDLHFGHGGATHRWNQQLVLETLRENIKKRVQEQKSLSVALARRRSPRGTD
ncbi:MAG TPA: hypothetical protein PK156_34835 [Polyangium sp.]|nr:hypothetical protein [Polyangium sp.]